jgi:hypothetical protein
VFLEHSAILGSLMYELVGRTFLMDPQDDGQRTVDLVKDHQSKLRKLDHHHKFRISVNDDQYEEVITYNELMDFIQKNEENDAIVWRFWQIVRHQGPLLHSDPDYKDSKFNVMVEWENGETTTEPLSVIAADNPVTCAIYAKDGETFPATSQASQVALIPQCSQV